MQAIVSELEQHGATLVAITPQKVEKSREMIDKHKLSFDMLSDPGNAYADRLGLRCQLPADMKAVYMSVGIDLEAAGGTPDWTLPIPARIVVDRGGIVRATDIDPDYTCRPEPEKTVSDVAALG